MEKATFAGGCFWCLEAVYLQSDGVLKAEPGYAGGQTANPTYKQVCAGKTGHAEAVQLTFNPEKISFRDLLEVFFSIHDPTTLNRQGADEGTQYRSAIFYQSEEQKKTAEEMIRNLDSEKIWKNPIVTELKPITEFYKAEDYHQNYYELNKNQSYCQIVISPKLEKFKKKFSDKIKK